MKLSESSCCRIFLLAGSFGRTLAAEARSTQGCNFLLSKIGAGIIKPLLTVGDVSILNEWLSSLKACPRMLPLSKKVFLVVNDDHYAAYCQWAVDPAQSLGGFPVENILNNGTVRGLLLTSVYDLKMK